MVLKMCRYNVARNQWDVMPPMRLPRSDASAVVHNSRMYVCGGYDGLNVHNSVEYFNEVLGVWLFAPPMQLRRSGLASVSYRGHLTVIGGFDGQNRSGQVEYLDDADMTWKRLPDMVVPRLVFVSGHCGSLLLSAKAKNHDSSWYSTSRPNE